MPKKLKLSIPEPCHENWENMTQAEKGRFCGSCEKQVVDFTNMSDSQLVAFFKKKSTGDVCGRFMPEQLNRAMDIPKKRIPWVKYFFQFTLPLFLASLKAGAQEKPKADTTQYEQPDTIPPPDRALIGDTIILPGSVDTSVFIDSIAKIDTKAVDDTSPLIPVKLEPTEITQLIRGYKELICHIRTGDMILGWAIPELVDDQPRIVIMENGSIKTYPNPVKGELPINIEIKNLEEDYYYLQVMNQAGQPVYNKEIWIDKEAAVLNIPMPKLSEGVYFMVLTSRQKKKKFTDKIIIH